MSAADATLPNLFVIGAPKCGTTSLHHYLDQHPSVSMSRIKEPWVFAASAFRQELAAYSDLLESSAPVRGESSAVYSLYPYFPSVPERIASVVPEASIIYVVGDPVERAVAHYAQRLTDGTETRPLEIALGTPESEDNVYLAGSRYATQLERYLHVFKRDQVLVIDQDVLRERTGEALAAAYEFLGVDASFSTTQFETRLNTREAHRTSTRLGSLVREAEWFNAARNAPLPAVVRDPLRRLFSSAVGRPDISPALRRRITSALSSEVKRLRAITGEDFPGWSV